jgi:hypothetical protein
MFVNHLKVLIYEKRGGLKVVAFDRSQLNDTKFNPNLFSLVNTSYALFVNILPVCRYGLSLPWASEEALGFLLSYRQVDTVPTCPTTVIPKCRDLVRSLVVVLWIQIRIHWAETMKQNVTVRFRSIKHSKADSASRGVGEWFFEYLCDSKPKSERLER